MATTILCDFPLDFPFWFIPERTTIAYRNLDQVRQQPIERETEILIE